LKIFDFFTSIPPSMKNRKKSKKFFSLKIGQKWFISLIYTIKTYFWAVSSHFSWNHRIWRKSAHVSRSRSRFSSHLISNLKFCRILNFFKLRFATLIEILFEWELDYFSFLFLFSSKFFIVYMYICNDFKFSNSEARKNFLVRSAQAGFKKWAATCFSFFPLFPVWKERIEPL